MSDLNKIIEFSIVSQAIKLSGHKSPRFVELPEQ